MFQTNSQNVLPIQTNYVQYKLDPLADMNNYPNVLTPPLDSPDSMMSSPASGSNTPPHTMIPQGTVQPYSFNSTTQYQVPKKYRPRINIVEEPVDKFRFRYKSEMAGTHGSLTGKTSDRTRKQTFPCVKLSNFDRPAVVRCSLFQWSREEMAHTRQPHAHRLVKKHGSEEVDDPHDIRVSKDVGYYANFHSMGIIHTAKKYIAGELTRKNGKLKQEEVARLEGKVRPLTKKEELEVKTLAEKESKSINLNIVCLKFDAFEEINDIYYPICPSIYSCAINNLKSALTGDLKIVRMDHCTSPSRGGKEIFILVEKVTKKNIKVRFFELDDEDNEMWSDYGRFTDLDVHHQYAIVFKTPPYKVLDIDKQIKVYIELMRPTDGARSEPKDFTYTPCEITHSRKRPRNYSSYSSGSYFSSDELPATIPQVINTNFNEMQTHRSVVNSGDLDEALKHNNVNSAEFKKICDQLLGSEVQSWYAAEEYMIDSEEFQNLLVTDSPQDALKDEKLRGPQRNSLLRRAILNDPSLARRLTQEEILITNRVRDEITSFLTAQKDPSKHRITIMLESLLQTPKYISENGNTALHLVILNNQQNRFLLLLLRMLLKYQLSKFVNVQNKRGQTPLHLAIQMNNHIVVEHLMNTKADASIQDVDGNTPLHLAIIKNASVTILKLLLNVANVGKYIDMENYDGLSAIHLAVKMNNIPATKLLSWNNANVNIEHKKNGYTPLHMAVADQHLEIVNFLLEGTEARPDSEDYMQCNTLKLAKVLIQQSKPVTQKIYDNIENYMKRNGIYEEVTIKEEMEDMSDEDIESVKVEPVKLEPIEMMEQQIPDNPKTDDFTENCLDQVCDILDKSGTWQNLAEQLDYGHLLRTADVFTSMEKPSKSLINFALSNGDSLQQIRDSLEHLNELKAVEIIENMIKKEQRD